MPASPRRPRASAHSRHIRRADIAMDHARSGRVARPVWFDAGMERALLAQSEIEQGIRYRPRARPVRSLFRAAGDLATGEIVGFEMLARWNHPLSGIIGPDVFIPVAEEIGLIGRLSEQVIAEALREAASGIPATRSRSTSRRRSSPTAGSRSGSSNPCRDGLSSRAADRRNHRKLALRRLDLARTIVTSLKNQGIRLALDDSEPDSHRCRICARCRSISSRSTAASSATSRRSGRMPPSSAR